MFTNNPVLVDNPSTVNIDTRSTRAMDAKLEIGKVVLKFKDSRIMLSIPPEARDHNAQAVDDIERIVHNYIGGAISAAALEQLADAILPLVSKLKVYGN